MATQTYSITVADGWVKVVDALDTYFIVENDIDDWIKLRFDTSAPALDAAYHTLRKREGMIRVSTGSVYIATESLTPVKFQVSI